ncbi:hypothetical protein QE379_002428 [Sphingomonas sp. SORGH_AS 879]|nr:hypothetical protein [Sphingomonas sp. SORGH_AS_0879]
MAITVRSVRARAIWIAAEPTPPAPPMIRMARAPPAGWLSTFNRSNRVSHAVMAVSGNAAASAKPMLRGRWPTIRSSTS